MTTLSWDTDSKSEALQLEGLRRMTDWRKAALLIDANRTARALALTGLLACYPDDGPAQLRRRLADLVLGPDLAARAFGAGPEKPR